MTSHWGVRPVNPFLRHMLYRWRWELKPRDQLKPAFLPTFGARPFRQSRRSL